MTNFDTLSPEVNVRNIRGVGDAPMRAAQAAWKDLADEFHSNAKGWEAQTSATEGVFEGAAATAFRTAAREHGAWLMGHAELARKNAGFLKNAVFAYNWAIHKMVPLSQIRLNRAEALMLKNINFLGQFTGKISMLDSAYQDMWMQNAKAMNYYQIAVFDIIQAAEETAIIPAPLLGSQALRNPEEKNKLMSLAALVPPGSI